MLTWSQETNGGKMKPVLMTPVEEAGLRAHGLDIGTPSQLSDVFRQGVAWGMEACKKQPTFQQRVAPWMQECFGEVKSKDSIERNHRFLEESLELVQSLGCTQSEAHQLVDYVFSRPVGEPMQEVGGVMVTIAALCLAAGMDMHEAGEVELARIWTCIDKIRAKQAEKPKNSPLPEACEKQQTSEIERLRQQIAIYENPVLVTGLIQVNKLEAEKQFARAEALEKQQESLVAATIQMCANKAKVIRLSSFVQDIKVNKEEILSLTPADAKKKALDDLLMRAVKETEQVVSHSDEWLTEKEISVIIERVKHG